MLNWIAWNKTIWSFNCVQTDDWCLIKLYMLNSNTCKHLSGCKQVIDGKWSYLRLIELSETIQLHAKKNELRFI